MKKKPAANDWVHFFGIALSEEYMDDLWMIIDKKKHGRHEIDNPEFSHDAIYARLQLAFNNDELIIEHPDEQESAFDKFPTWVDLNPNDQVHINVQRTVPQLQWIYSSTMTQDNEMMRKFKMMTGGGPGHAKDVATWRDRPTFEISDYNAESAMLTWIFMKDKEKDHPLSPSSDSIPNGREAGATSTTATALVSSAVGWSSQNLSWLGLDTGKLLTIMKHGNSQMAEAIKSLSYASSGSIRSNAARINEVLDALDKAEDCWEKIAALPDSDDSKVRKLLSIDSAIQCLHAELAEIQPNNN